MDRSSVFTLIGVGVGLYFLHAMATNWMVNNTVRACSDPSYRNGAAVCSCVKSGMRGSLAVEKAVLGIDAPEILQTMQRCKGV